MEFDSVSADAPEGTAETVNHELLLTACRAVLAPLARLAVARGVPFAEIDELLRTAFVQAAREVHPNVPAHRAVSRISAATGINRREVTRLLNETEPERPQRHSPPTQTFTRWLSDPRYRDNNGLRRVLPRQGAAPSFESLAQSVTRDVHPRSLLEEMCRLGLVRLDDDSDTVELLRDRLVPQGDQRRLYQFLGSNVGDHFSAAVANVLSPDKPRHLEQAVFADEMSAEAINAARPLIAEQWQRVMRELGPQLTALIDQDNRENRESTQRLRVGMYAFAAPNGEPESLSNSESQPEEK